MCLMNGFINDFVNNAKRKNRKRQILTDDLLHHPQPPRTGFHCLAPPLASWLLWPMKEFNLLYFFS